MRVTVAILTKNGDPWIRQVLEAVLSQQGPFHLEVLVIDSGSWDQTTSIVEEYPVRLERIEPESFNHGQTRNLAISLATGERIALLSQDATPQDSSWLHALIQPLDDEGVAGAFSRHVPRPGSSPLVQRQTVQFDLCGSETSRFNVLSSPQEDGRRACFFANTSSCIRRSIWEAFPFRRLDFAEDQEWALRVLRAGYATVYAADSVVIHSHDYSLPALFMRAFEHARAMRRIYGSPEIDGILAWQRALRQHLLADWHFLFNGTSLSTRSRIAWAARALPWQTVRLAGLWSGSHASRLPQRLSDSLCLQKRLARRGP